MRLQKYDTDGSTEISEIYMPNNGDMQFQTDGNNIWCIFDRSVGDIEFKTGTGATAQALLLDASQNATFAVGVNIADGIRLTEQADHRTTPAATFGEVWLRDDANQTLMFTDDAGVDHEIAGTDVAGGGGPGGWNYTLQTGTTYTASVSDFVAASNTGSVTITLPSGHSAGDEIMVKKTGASGTVTVDANASETIDGALTFALTAQYASILLVSNGTNWWIA